MTANSVTTALLLLKVISEQVMYDHMLCDHCITFDQCVTIAEEGVSEQILHDRRLRDHFVTVAKSVNKYGHVLRDYCTTALLLLRRISVRGVWMTEDCVTTALLVFKKVTVNRLRMARNCVTTA